jgi:hypothetical protein
VVVLVDLDELAEHWTLVEDERELVAGKQGPTRLGFALLLKFYTRAGRFPRGRAELEDDAVAFVARQVGVPASDHPQIRALVGRPERRGTTRGSEGDAAAHPDRVPARRPPTCGIKMENSQLVNGL